ncbi:MAG: alpha-glucosidase/alpha-galactosidase [Clostridia bacterium]|nr:alpha-glucosidase/alpha-galactosidase [Clostridia bacterium]
MKKYNESKTKVSDLKIAYIGGGSRGWAYILMKDLAQEPDLSGCVNLYDIDFEAACCNEIIGNRLSAREDVVGKWKYEAKKTLQEALTDADFVFISILPGTFDEMESDVHLPEKYGIYQSVGDTTGPGGIIRALRTVPMFQKIALAVKEYCPKAWVVNFTNPMTVCVRTLYKTFPQIKAFGCCHEVFGTQQLILDMLKEKYGVQAKRTDLKTNVVGINHFTWLTEAKYKGIDLYELFGEYVKAHPNGTGVHTNPNWVNLPGTNLNMVKFDLFKRYGVIAAAGDRHLAEFCNGYWYLKDPDTVKSFGFTLTTVEYRKKELNSRLEKAKKYASGEAQFVLDDSGEESVRQIKALLGLGDIVTNVNIPNMGQVPNNPKNAVLETNAVFSEDSVRPVFAGEVPLRVNALVMRIIEEQEAVVEAGMTGDYELAFSVFVNNPNVNLPFAAARKLFDEMLENTKAYLPFYEQYKRSRNNG